MVEYGDVVGSTIYEGSDESKSKSGSTDSHGSTTRQSSSSTASSSRSAHSTTSQSATATAATHNCSAPVSTVFPACRASVTEDVASVVRASCVGEVCH